MHHAQERDPKMKNSADDDGIKNIEKSNSNPATNQSSRDLNPKAPLKIAAFEIISGNLQKKMAKLAMFLMLGKNVTVLASITST